MERLEVTPMPKKIPASVLDFVTHNVLQVTDLTRKGRLAEILDAYSCRESSEIYVVQNAKRPGAQAALVDVRFLKELLTVKELVDEAVDDLVASEVKARLGEPADVPLADLVSKLGIDLSEVARLAESEETEE